MNCLRCDRELDDDYEVESSIVWCSYCGCLSGYNNKLIPEILKWKDFEKEPPIDIEKDEIIVVKSTAVNPDEDLIDFANYNVYSNQWKRDFFCGAKIEKWRRFLK